MDRGQSVTEQKLAEKLTILNERGVGMLTRIYNIKKACSEPKSRPGFLTDKTLESSIKYIVRKFPSTDCKAVQVQPVQSIQNEVIKGLSNYYFTFVDIMEYKDHVCELLTSIDASFVHFDISLNFELTKAYLDLIVNFVSLLILVSRVDDRKSVLGLFNYAFEMQKGRSEESFPRLGQMIIDYENPLKKLAEQFVPHQQRVATALQSIHNVFVNRQMTGEQWRQSQILSIISLPAQMLNPAISEVMPLDYLSGETLQKWLLFGYTLCHQQLAMPGVVDIWRIALHDGYCLTIFRDEVFMFHKEFTNLLDGMKGYNKRVKDIQESANQGISSSGALHRERRNYLRAALCELSLILGDQPGLLGPKILIVLQALSYARDEIHWLVRHNCNSPPKGRKINHEDYQDGKLPQLLLHIEELRGMIQKYTSVLQRYFIQYMSGFDLALLKEIVPKISICSEDISMIMTSFLDELSPLSVKQVEAGTQFNFRALRLDWLRLQAYTSVRSASPELKDNRDLAVLMNTVAFHTLLVDSQEEILNETSDLSIFCFYPSFFENAFSVCLHDTDHCRYSIAFPLMCAHFMTCTNDFCPEERHPIGDRSLSAVNMFLEAMAKEAVGRLSSLCSEHIHLNQQLWHVRAVRLMSEMSQNKKKDKNKKNMQAEFKPPGSESFRKSREVLTSLDSKILSLTEICHAITYAEAIPVWEHVFTPKEYLSGHIEEFFSKSIVNMVQYDPDNLRIAPPSEVLKNVKALLTCLRILENYIGIDMARVFNHVLMQHTQPQDSQGNNTVAYMYAAWYVDVFLRRVIPDGICFSPRHKSFISRPAQQFKAEEYTDLTELRALAELLGAYGMKYMSEKMMQQVANQVAELKKLVLQNKDILQSLRTSFDKPDQCSELLKRMKNTEDVIQRMTIIGVILNFRTLTQEALSEVLINRVPFLLNTVVDFKDHFPHGNNDRVVVDEMATAAGLTSAIDPVLCSALRSLKEKKADEDSLIWSLLLVFIAVALPSLAQKETTEFNPELEAHENNAHCIAAAINGVTGALCSNNGDSHEERLREFLAIASSSLLKLGIDQEKDIKARESTYILLDLIVQKSPFLTMDILESCFPYALLRDSYHVVYKCKRKLGRRKSDSRD